MEDERRGPEFRRVEHCPMHNTNVHMLRVVGIGFALVIVIMGVVSFAVLAEVDSRDKAQDAAARYTAQERARIDKAFNAGQYAACVRGNRVRAWIRYRSGKVGDAAEINRKVFPILDCQPFLYAKIGPPLPAAQQDAFIEGQYPHYRGGS